MSLEILAFLCGNLAFSSDPSILGLSVIAAMQRKEDQAILIDCRDGFRQLSCRATVWVSSSSHQVRSGDLFLLHVFCR